MTKLYNLPSRTSLRKKLRSTLTKGEAILWKRLQSSKLGYKFRRQYGIGTYVLDFYCPRVRLSVEVDGLSHEGDAAMRYDQARDAYLQVCQISILHFTSSEIFSDLERVLQNIHQRCVELEGTKHHP